MNLETKYIIALTNLYGIVHPDKVLEIYNMQNDDQIDSLLNCCGKDLDDEHIYYESDYFVSELIKEFEEEEVYIEAQLTRPFYIPEKDELLKYIDSHYIENNEQYKALKRYLADTYNVSDECVKKFIDSMVVSIKMEHELPVDYVEMNSDYLELDGIDIPKELNELCLSCCYNTRMWCYNGYTYIEANNLSNK